MTSAQVDAQEIRSTAGLLTAVRTLRAMLQAFGSPVAAPAEPAPVWRPPLTRGLLAPSPEAALANGHMKSAMITPNMMSEAAEAWELVVGR